MKRWAYILLIQLLLLGCSTDAEYRANNVDLNIEVLNVSCGFCEVHFETSKPAYYYIAAEKVREGVDPLKIEEQFKTLSLDYAYKNYINWRYELLYNGEPHIAEFSSHSLQYGEMTHFFTSLEEDTDYWVYAFIVDPYTNSPVGELVIEEIHTKPTSEEKIYFKYRVDDTWDYVYPLDEEGKINPHIPWVGETVDSLVLRNEIKPVTPGYYFIDRMQDLRTSGKAYIRYGMYAHNNDGIGDGSSLTEFVEGHTYYTAIACFDGPIILEGKYKNYSIYKFKWKKGLKQVFTREDDTMGAW